MIKKYFQINLASPKKILKWSERSLPNGELVGKITKSDTVDYKTFRPIKDGLFCEKIFGPTKKNECSCKLYKKIKIKAKNANIIICPRCNVQITDSKIRRYRMGYIELALPNIHPLYLNNLPSYISVMLAKPIKEVKKIVSTESYILVKKNKREIWETSGEAINFLLKRIKLKKIANKIRDNILSTKKNRKNLINRYKLINNFIETKSKPEWMTIKFLPVLPPELRPLMKLQDNVIVSSDFNILYAKIINSNNRIIQLKNMKINEKFLKKEKQILQESIDSLIDKSQTKSKKKLKSLTKTIKGKHGRIRENLLGKTVDYSARSVITVEPKLKINECGIPIDILLELFQPILIKKIIQLKLANNIKEAKKEINKKNVIQIKLLKKIIFKYPILLNRAPTLHRIGIQSFQPIMTKQKSIKLHPMVCAAFNADFDGDQMGIHLPLSLKGQAESRTLMISSNNCTLPATGESNLNPSQDMILGCYFLTNENINLFYLLEKIRYFKNIKKALISYKKKELEIHSFIWINEKNRYLKKIKISKIKSKIKKSFVSRLNRTTPGRIIFSKVINEFL
uniref:DNA-directed RNA polymerase subunit n=1 Tax=Phacus inflexus TaxID=461210 RepID=A0A3G3LKQ0_9EUGL|nr:RNA polymerase beta' subunit [Phacus inflexus]AYQ93291.1 RNA polymerase beta' subunit [Phacus inflexus]